ncbi:MAG: hypothetical protein PHG66_06870 [Candidatus Colwellbacteria bacterium]|nr:hypothetical protein [Candidatus Colwellbacteria bacterium]
MTIAKCIISELMDRLVREYKIDELREKEMYDRLFKEWEINNKWMLE